MLSRNQIKYITDLSQKSVRYAERKFVVEGEKLVAELISSRFTIEGIYAIPGWESPYGGEIIPVSEKELGRISHLKTPNKVLAVVRMPEENGQLKMDSGLTLFLDRINDPGNLGTIIRMADWFGVNQIICTENSVDVFNNKVIQSSMGSVFRVPVHYVDGMEFLTQFASDFPEIPVLAADMAGETLGEFSFPENAVLVMGSESHGIDSRYRPVIQRWVNIPRFGQAESLNVGVATGIILWEWKRGVLPLKM